MRINRSKYGFSKLKVGDSFDIDPMDVYSMRNSLRFYNNNHGKSVEVSVPEQVDSETGKMKITRTK